jgi:hypothetical protein
VTVDATRWFDVILQLAPAKGGAGFVAVDITQEDGSNDPGMDADGFPTGGLLIAGPSAQPQQNLTR